MSFAPPKKVTPPLSPAGVASYPFSPQKPVLPSKQPPTELLFSFARDIVKQREQQPNIRKPVQEPLSIIQQKDRYEIRSLQAKEKRLLIAFKDEPIILSCIQVLSQAAELTPPSPTPFGTSSSKESKKAVFNLSCLLLRTAQAQSQSENISVSNLTTSTHVNKCMDNALQVGLLCEKLESQTGNPVIASLIESSQQKCSSVFTQLRPALTTLFEKTG